MQKIRNIVLVLALVGVTSLLSFKVGEKRAVVKTSGGQLDLSMMWTVKDKLQQKFLNKDKMIDKDMVYGAISGMVASLGDPYTVYLPPEQNKNSNEDLAGQFGGVGISLGYKDKNIAVMSPLAKTPAERAGLLAGDLILNITDKANNVNKDTSGMTLEEAVKLIRGKVGTEVTLKIFRTGKPEPWEVTLKRDNIVVPGVELAWVGSAKGKVAWVKMYKFSDTLYTEWTQIVGQINQEKSQNKVAGIVLDLRNNPGGYLQASVMVASDFLKDGVVVSQQSSEGSVEKYSVDKSLGRLLNDKLVVLVNGGSASASEILAGALKEFKRAQLVGEKTFGKGTVQQPENFPDGSGLHVTIAKWLLPNGTNIHGVGVEPDVPVVYMAPTPTATQSGGQAKSAESLDNQLQKAVEVLIK
jgi:carboxyl-terminal processing protease